MKYVRNFFQKNSKYQSFESSECDPVPIDSYNWSSAEKTLISIGYYVVLTVFLEQCKIPVTLKKKDLQNLNVYTESFE